MTSHGPIFSSDDAPVLVGIMVVLLVFGVGFGVGRWTGRAVMHTPPSAKAEVMPSVPLRCTNGAETAQWTQAEREARYHSARMWHRTAEEAGVWNGRGARAFRLAALGYLEVIACSGEAP